MADETKERSMGTWELESGLIDDVDAWIKNARFGFKEEYANAVMASSGEQGGAMFMFDLEDENGEIIGQQGYSIGTGWEISEDGLEITHPKRKNVVHSCMYGLLQKKVILDLGVDMEDRGMPTEAATWEGLGFHWSLQPHTTVSGAEKMGLMPDRYLGVKGEEALAGEDESTEETQEEEAPAPAKKPAVAKPATATANLKARAAAAKASAGEAEALKLVAACASAKEFMLKAMKVPAIVNDDPLMAKCTDTGPTGFFSTHKNK